MTRWKPDAQERLVKAAIELFAERGYDATTVAEIAEAAGLTRRSFFRYFSEKREVLFAGSESLVELWRGGIVATGDGSPLDMVAAGFGPVAEMFEQRQEFARQRAQVILENPELLERELIKLQRLAAALGSALVERGVPAEAASLASQIGVTVFHVAFGRWIGGDNPPELRVLLAESLEELRTLV